MSGRNYGDEFRANAARDADLERARFLEMIALVFDQLTSIEASLESNVAKAVAAGDTHLSLTAKVRAERIYERKKWPTSERLIEELVKSTQYRALWDTAKTLGLAIRVDAKQSIGHETSTYNPHGGCGFDGGDYFCGFEVMLDFRSGASE